MYGLSLQWKKCPDGVEPHDYGPARQGKTISQTPKSGVWFRFRSARREAIRYDVSDLDDPIILRFVNATDDEKRATFFSRYGMPAEHDTSAGEIDKGETELWQGNLTVLLERAGSGLPMTAINAVNKAISSHATFAPFPVLGMADDAKRPRLTLRPQSLLGLMLMETAILAAVGARTTTCHHCHEVFLTGQLTGRRSTAQFCSDRCRVAASRARKSKNS